MTEPGQVDLQKASQATSRRKTLLRGFVLAIVLLSGLVFLASVQIWFSITLPEKYLMREPVTVEGRQAAPALTAFAFVTLASGVALTLANKVVRWLVLVLFVAASASIVWGAGSTLLDPLAASQSAIGEAAGVTGVTGEVAYLPWGYLSLISGILLVLLGAAGAIYRPLWPVRSAATTSRFELSGQKNRGAKKGTSSAGLSDVAEAAEESDLDPIGLWEEQNEQRRDGR